MALDENGDFHGTIPSAMRRAGLLLDPDGRWVPPTPAAALRELRRPLEPGELGPGDPARAVLTQRFGALSRPELDALADELVRIALSEWVPGARFIRKSRAAMAAMLALRGSAKTTHGVPYEGAFDTMRRIWEVSSGDAPPGERWDSMGALTSLYGMEPEGRARDMPYAEIAADVFAPSTSFRTPPSIWRQGREAIIAWNLRRLDEDLRGLPGDAALFESHCGPSEIRTP